MWKTPKSRAEQQFAAAQKKDQALISQKEKTQRERDVRMARLRELRLAKEAADKAAAEENEPPQQGAPTAAVKAPAPAGEAKEVPGRLARSHTHRS